ncbi:MAG: bifunctional (p)ppGpp synthetase/guanosine-3',5'-bis(diphosphate) 3'-pyrophosphohydrolase [Defluviitaleaceae bacterium]|nr:bifunctional (p)ppGpp synthetase/guanosine-3',5'-bis(diphosphate) 3'-pyrophosphohydrolase [Defluviitaleaceae bacterium]
MTHEQIFENIIKRISEYHPSPDFSLLREAYRVAVETHGDQLRKSGEPYVIHPMSVAYILADLEMDIESIIAGILHDVIEDTPYSYEDMAAEFSSEIANIVDGVTRLDKIEDDLKAKREKAAEGKVGEEKASPKKKRNKEEAQAENYRKMFVAMAKDIRVILIKIADRLHNMRTLQFVPPEKQIAKAQETIDIYAPLASRLGIAKIKSELQDLSFKYLRSEAYDDLLDKISKKEKDGQKHVDNIIAVIKSKMQERGFAAVIDGRAKHIYSTFRKMLEDNKTLDQVYDLFAIRIIVDSVAECYESLGIVHNVFSPIPGRLKDYIAMPKANMYQSLHTVVVGPSGSPFEVQIRTHEMHRTAEHGIAAHWKYKEGKASGSTAVEEDKLPWLSQMLAWQGDLSDDIEYLSELKSDLDIHADSIQCFTPKGEVITLPVGSTPIDFAYSIHSEVGNKMIGCRINEIIVPFEYKINPGDRVVVLTSQNGKGPSHDWLSIAKTNQARTKIRQWFKKENKEENVVRGRELLERDAKRRGFSLPELLTAERKKIILEKYGFLDWDAVCAAIGHGGIKEAQVINRLNESFQSEQSKRELMQVKLKKDSESFKKVYANKTGVMIDGLAGISIRYSKCCGPVPGDAIIGFVTTGNGVSIHRTDCINITNLDELSRPRLIDADWHIPAESKKESYSASIKITGDDRVGFMHDISKFLMDEKIPIMDFSAQANYGVAIFYAIIQVEGKDQLDKVINKLRSMPGITRVERSAK